MEERLAALAFVFGVIWRYYFILHFHRANQFIFSDMETYTKWAVKFFGDKPIVEGFYTQHPPLAIYFFGFLRLLDPSWEFANWAQFFISCTIPVLIYYHLLQGFSRQVALVGLALASLYLPLVHLAGYYLTENLFTFLLLLSYFVLYRAVSNPLLRKTYFCFAGFFFALASGTKIVAMGSLAVTLLYLFFFAEKKWIALREMGLLLLAFGLTSVPFAMRCTRLNGGNFCLFATGMQTVLMGHRGDFGMARFQGAKRSDIWQYIHYPKWTKGNHTIIQFPFLPHDTKAIWKELWEWNSGHPFRVVKDSLYNIACLFFAGPPWPTAHGPEAIQAKIFYQWSIFGVVLFLLLLLNFGALPSAQKFWLGFTLTPIFGLFGVVAVSYGEPRYRIPYDPFLLMWISVSFVMIVNYLSKLSRSLKFGRLQ